MKVSTRTIEITAKTEAEARQIATGELNSNEEIVNAETLSAPARGLFGLVGKQEYKIRFTIGEKPEEKVEAQVERLTGRPSENSDEDEFSEEDGAAPTKNNRREWAPRRNSRRERPERGGRRNNRHYRNDFRAEGDSEEEKIEIPERPKEPVSEEIKNHEGYSQIFELIRGVAENVGIENVQLVDYMRDGAWVIEASAEDVSQLIGKRGHTLDSLQYLMNIIFNKNTDDDRINGFSKGIPQISVLSLSYFILSNEGRFVAETRDEIISFMGTVSLMHDFSQGALHPAQTLLPAKDIAALC